MRVWAATDPRLLCRKHLLGEHVEVHMLMSAVDGRGWTRHPEARRWSEWPDGRDFLLMRHDMLRQDMDRRWPGRHTRDQHRTPTQLPHEGRWFVIMRGYELGVEWRSLVEMMAPWPDSPFGADTPWDRDGMTLDEYLDIGDAWNAAEHKRGGANAAR